MPAPLRFLQRCSLCINRFQQHIAHCLRWLIAVMTMTVCLIIALRYFDIGSTALQESVTYMHAILFMLTLAYTASVDGHVRVDILYRRMPAWQQDWVNLIGACLFLLPFALFMLLASWSGAWQSWAMREGSINPGGLPFVYVLKALIPLSGTLLCLHALSEIGCRLCAVSLKQPLNDCAEGKPLS